VSEDRPNYQTAAAQLERINAEAVRLHEQDMRARRIADSAIHQAMENCPREIEPRDVESIATHAVMLALAMVYDQDGDLKVARAERDHYKKLAEDVLATTTRPMFIPSDPGIPIYRHPDGTDEVLGDASDAAVVLAAAIQSELRRQGVLYEDNPAEPDPTKLMMNTGEAADLPALVGVILEVSRGK